MRLYCFMYVIKIIIIIIVKAIDNLENKNSSGHDGISNKVLNYIKLELSNSLTLIVNQMLTTGIFPDSFKSLKLHQYFKREIPLC